MAYDLEEQEQIAQLKAFWQTWAKVIVPVTAVAVLTYAGWQGYEWYQKRQIAQAQQVFAQYQAQVRKKADGTSLVQQLQNEYPKVNYTALASLQQANTLSQAGEFEKARGYLQWVIDHGQPENQGAARLRMADVLLQLGKKEEAIAAVATSQPHYAAAFANKKADIYLITKEPAKAREVMTQAIDEAKKAGDGETVEILTQKLQMVPSVN